MTCEASKGKYLLTVRDSGVGIPSEMQPHIFDRFYRADEARSRGSDSNGAEGSGAGLGLSIAQLAAEAHAGQLELVCSDGTGSLFLASLPRPNLD